VVVQAAIEAAMDPHKPMVDKLANWEAGQVRKPKADSQKPVTVGAAGLSSRNVLLESVNRAVMEVNPRATTPDQACL
jgi:hypothetical protein